MSEQIVWTKFQYLTKIWMFDQIFDVFNKPVGRQLLRIGIEDLF